MADKNNELSELHYDIESGFGCAKQLYDDARKAGVVITLDEVKEWLRGQTLKHRKSYKNFNSYSPPFARAVYSVDIMNMVCLMKDTGTYELASKLLVCGNGGNHLGCPVSFCRSGRYRFGVSFFRVPHIVLQWF